MTKFEYAEGWNKEKVMAQVEKYNNGTMAMNPAGISCVYRAQAGNRCAIGCFIPDNHSAFFSSASVRVILEKYPELNNYMPFKDINALRAFQKQHDDAGKCNVHIILDRWLEENMENK